jgi:hypothetical protein
VVERPHVGNRCLYTHCYLEINVGENRDRAGPFWGTSGTLGREGRGECCVYSDISVWYPPSVLVKDRGVGTREQVLNISIAWWCLWAQ